MEEEEWNDLWKVVIEVGERFGPGLVYIGGVAVYAHTLESELHRNLFKFSHDADFMISVSDYTDLKDIEQVTPNKRLRKLQFYKGGFEFDVYVENQNGLVVPYDEAAACSVVKSGIRVACIEHLILLKLKAYEDRRGSAKGQKDEDDLFTLLLLVSECGVQSDTIARMDDRMEELLAPVVHSDAAVRLTGGNHLTGAALRRSAEAGFRSVMDARRSAMKLGW